MFNKINTDLYEYLNIYIFPQYTLNDSGHGAEHINYVIRRCLNFAEQFENLNVNILYTAAVFHDIAHHIDKNNHEKLSAEMFYDNEAMKSFFTNEERLQIKEAIEDHRASSSAEPRSIYGKILSSADRSTDVDKFLRRTHAYTLKHQPDSSYDEIITRAYNHTKEKYGENGYAKSYVNDFQFDCFINTIAEILKDKKVFEKRYIQAILLQKNLDK